MKTSISIFSLTLWLYGIGLFFAPKIFAQTTLNAGDIAIIGYNSNFGTACGGTYDSDDVIALVTFVDIENNTSIIITDKGYNNEVSGVQKFRSTEGAVELVRTGGTLTAGSIFYITIGNATAICGTGNPNCAQGWSINPISSAIFLDMNSTNGDQFFVLQGTFTGDTDFVGKFIYGLSTNNDWTYADNATSSNLPSGLNCLNMKTNEKLNYYYSGTVTSNTREKHLANVYNNTNWTTGNPSVNPTCPTTSSYKFDNFPAASFAVDKASALGEAGTDQTICNATTILAGTASDAGKWTVIKGTATFTSNTSPTTMVSGLAIGENILRWTPDNCAKAFDEVTLTRTAELTANAGTDQTTCGTSLSLDAKISTGTGTWTVVSGTGTFGNANLATTLVSGLSNGANIFRWTVTQSGCTPATDEVTITVADLNNPSVSINTTATNEQICAGGSVTFTATTTKEGSKPTFQWKLNGNNVGSNQNTYTAQNLKNGDIITLALNNNASCPNPTATSNAFTVQCSTSTPPPTPTNPTTPKTSTELFMPTLFSPNNDSKNDRLKIEAINPKTINSFDFKIYDRNGILVYQTSNPTEILNNGWDGNFQGNAQPAGTYVWEVKGEFEDKTPVRINGKTNGVVNLAR